MLKHAVKHLRSADPVLGRVIVRVGPCGYAPARYGSHFEAVARAIVGQQLSGRAATTIYGRVRALCGGTPKAEHILALSDQALRGAGLSGQKLRYLKDLAARVEGGTLVLKRLDRLPDEQVIAALTEVKGVGVWTAQMFLMFRLGRPDVLPDADLGIRKGVQQAFGLRALPSPERVRKLGAKWRPYASVASWYLWRSLDGDT